MEVKILFLEVSKVKKFILSCSVVLLGIGLAGCGNNASKHNSTHKKGNNTEVVSSKKDISIHNSTSQKQEADSNNNLWNDNKNNKLNSYIMSWEKTLNQNYTEYSPSHPLNYMGYEYPTIFPKQKITVQGQPVTVEWSNNGKGNKDYEVVAIYSDLRNTQAPSPHLYFFTIHNDRPVVLITQQTQGNDNNTVDFHPTENKDLANAFTAIIDGQNPQPVNGQEKNQSQNTDIQQQSSTQQNNQQQAAQQPQQNAQQNNQQQYTEQGHYPTWKEGNVYCAQLPDGTVMKQTFADGDDPGSYQGNPEVQHETAQMQEQWNKQHGIN